MKKYFPLLLVIIIAGCAHNRLRFVSVKSKEVRSTQVESRKSFAMKSTVEIRLEQIAEGDVISSNDLTLPTIKPFVEPSLQMVDDEISRKKIDGILKSSSNVNDHSKSQSFQKKSQLGVHSASKNGNFLFYSLGALILLSTFGFTYASKKTTFKLTRIAAKNILATRATLFFAQVGLGVLGYQSGKNFHEMGYTISENAQYIAQGVGGLTFLSLLIHDLFGKSLWKHFFARKFGFALISASLYASSMGIGMGSFSNTGFNSPITQAFVVEETYNPSENNDALYAEMQVENLKQAPDNKERKALQAWYIIGAILLGLILVVGSCLAFCSWGASGFFVAIPGLILYILFHVAMVKQIRQHPKV